MSETDQSEEYKRAVKELRYALDNDVCASPEELRQLEERIQETRRRGLAPNNLSEAIVRLDFAIKKYAPGGPLRQNWKSALDEGVIDNDGYLAMNDFCEDQYVWCLTLRTDCQILMAQEEEEQALVEPAMHQLRCVALVLGRALLDNVDKLFERFTRVRPSLNS
jgi:hypothetical protein